MFNLKSKLYRSKTLIIKNVCLRRHFRKTFSNATIQKKFRVWAETPVIFYLSFKGNLFYQHFKLARHRL